MIPVSEANKLESLCNTIGGKIEKQDDMLVCKTDNIKILLDKEGKFSIFIKETIIDPSINPTDILRYPLIFEKAMDLAIAKFEKLPEFEKAYLKKFIEDEKRKIKAFGIEINFLI